MLQRMASAMALALLIACERAPANPWPDDIVDAFLKGCRSRSPAATCACAADRLQRRFTLAEFQAFEREVTSGKPVPKPMADAVAECAGG